MNLKQNSWEHFSLIAKFVYNNTKNTSTSYMLFELNYGYYLQIFFEDNINFCSTIRLLQILLCQ